MFSAIRARVGPVTKLNFDNTGGQPVLHAHLIYPCAKDQQMLSSSS